MDAQRLDTKLLFKNELKKHSERIMGRENFSDLHFINGFSSGVEILAKVLMDKNPWMIIETVRSTATELLSHALEAVLSESERIR